MAYDLRPFLTAVEAIIASHRLAPGQYRRWNGPDPRAAVGGGIKHTPRDLGPNEYGIADAANLLYTLGRFPQESSDRDAWITALRGRQHPTTGLFEEATHHPIHTTAHCIAALELFDAVPAHPVRALLEHATPAGIVRFLEALDWRENPWNHSHRGAGLYVALALTGAPDRATAEAYFGWLWNQADPATGLWRVNCVAPLPHSGGTTRFPHLAGTFHYLFNLEYAHQPLRYPAALVDTCLQMVEADPFALGQSVGFAEIDWVYCLNRGLRQSGHRFGEAQTALRTFAEKYIPFLTSLDPATHDGLNDLHCLFGAVCCLAELQAALPGELITDRPLKLVLDRRPFI
ncbi:MAG TPA: hypothetical protein VL860_12855 [Planctomycetota bacterium]|nr:hypothetical protein [Planctomycetota bacterium]